MKKLFLFVILSTLFCSCDRSIRVGAIEVSTNTKTTIAIPVSKADFYEVGDTINTVYNGGEWFLLESRYGYGITSKQVITKKINSEE